MYDVQPEAPEQVSEKKENKSTVPTGVNPKNIKHSVAQQHGYPTHLPPRA